LVGWGKRSVCVKGMYKRANKPSSSATVGSQKIISKMEKYYKKQYTSFQKIQMYQRNMPRELEEGVSS